MGCKQSRVKNLHFDSTCNFTAFSYLNTQNFLLGQCTKVFFYLLWRAMVGQFPIQEIRVSSHIKGKIRRMTSLLWSCVKYQEGPCGFHD